MWMCVYRQVVRNVSLTDNLTGIANPKSSNGRLDVFTRLIVDGAMEFEEVQLDIRDPYMQKYL